MLPFWSFSESATKSNPLGKPFPLVSFFQQITPPFPIYPTPPLTRHIRPQSPQSDGLEFQIDRGTARYFSGRFEWKEGHITSIFRINLWKNWWMECWRSNTKNSWQKKVAIPWPWVVSGSWISKTASVRHKRTRKSFFVHVMQNWRLRGQCSRRGLNLNFWQESIQKERKKKRNAAHKLGRSKNTSFPQCSRTPFGFSVGLPMCFDEFCCDASKRM